MYKKFVLLLSLIMMVVILPNDMAAAAHNKYDGKIKKPNGDTEYYKFFQRSSNTTPLHNALDPLLIGMAAGCKEITYGVTYYDGLNHPTISFSQTVNWCYDGTKITWLSHTHGPRTYQPLYQYNGLIAHTHSGGIGTTSYRAHSQANMCEATPSFGCVWYLYPSVTETVNGNGTFSASATK